MFFFETRCIVGRPNDNNRALTAVPSIDMPPPYGQRTDMWVGVIQTYISQLVYYARMGRKSAFHLAMTLTFDL